MTTLTARQTFALVVLFVATSLAFMQLDGRRALDPVKEVVYSGVIPVMSVFSDLGNRTIDESAAERELAAVKAERDQLAAENSRLREAVGEIDQLRMQARLQEERPSWKMLQARVLARDPTASKRILIDKGRREGIEIGMAVVAQGPNYIGLVTAVEERSAEVTLVIDASQRVGARLDSGGDGVAYGMGRINGWIELRYVDRNAQPQPGDWVVTTDSLALKTARVPSGLIVGRVDPYVAPSNQGEFQTVPVLPLVDFDKLQVVTVVLTDDA
jgi:rod shape-determining protein MreC